MSELINANKREVKRVEKEWGYELWFANDINNNYCGKILHLNDGKKFSMHFHKDKAETFFVLNNKVKVRVIDTSTAKVHEDILNMGDSFEIQTCLPHQLEAIDGDVEIIEASTFHRDSDSYRVWR